MKQALITGASSGIGRAIAEALTANDWQVTGIARHFTKRSHELAQNIELDLSRTELLTDKLRELDPAVPDALILNAGVGLFGGLEQLSESQIRGTLDLNLLSPILMIKHFLPAMKREGQKDIILIGSEAALSGAKQGAVYCASKFAIRGLAQSLRADCSSADIRVMLVNPGPTDTEFFNDLHFEPSSRADTALKPDDVAAAVVNALQAPRNVVQEEINLQPMKRAFKTKRD